MKTTSFCLAFCFFMLTILSSCSVVCNSITTGYLCAAERGDALFFQLQFSDICEIDLKQRTFCTVKDRSDLDFVEPSGNWLKHSYFAGEYTGTVPQGFDGIKKHLEKCALDNESSVVDACGYLDNGFLKGFVQVYEDTSGVYGNYSIEKIAYSLIFSYDPLNDDFFVVRKFDNAVVVAVQNDTVIYWKDKVYYSYNMKTQVETYLVEDKAHDSGLSQLSTPEVLFNEKICVIHLVKGSMLSENNEYMYLFDFSTDEFVELQRRP